MNEFLKSFIPSKNYIDIYNKNNIIKLGPDATYMFDTNHLTEFGANQVYEKILSKYL